MAVEPTNERLQQWRDHPWAALNGNMSTEEFLGLVSALLSAREELAHAKQHVKILAAARDEVFAKLDVARAGEAMVREAAKPFQEAWNSRRVEQFEGHGIDRWGLTTKITLPMVRDIAEALSSTADSAKWLEERLAEARRHEGCRTRNQVLDSFALSHRCYTSEEETVDAIKSVIAEAEKRGYERGKAEGEIAGLRRAAAEIVPDGNPQIALNWCLSMADMLAARREKAETR